MAEQNTDPLAALAKIFVDPHAEELVKGALEIGTGKRAVRRLKRMARRVTKDERVVDAATIRLLVAIERGQMMGAAAVDRDVGMAMHTGAAVALSGLLSGAYDPGDGADEEAK